MRKENRTYYFSVEGDTEQWYLEWLQRAINAAPEAACTVKLDCKIQKDPFARVKRMKIVRKTEITHLFDYESGEEEYEREFKTVIDRMREAESSGKDIQYRIGYSNFTFELWMILHNPGKTDACQCPASGSALQDDHAGQPGIRPHTSAIQRLSILQRKPISHCLGTNRKNLKSLQAVLNFL